MEFFTTVVVFQLPVSKPIYSSSPRFVEPSCFVVCSMWSFQLRVDRPRLCLPAGINSSISMGSIAPVCAIVPNHEKSMQYFFSFVCTNIVGTTIGGAFVGVNSGRNRGNSEVAKCRHITDNTQIS